MLRAIRQIHRNTNTMTTWFAEVFGFKEFGPGERARNIAAFELSDDHEVLKSKANGMR